MKLWFMLTVLNVSFVGTLCSFCYWNSGCPYKYFASKTPYNSVRGDIRDSVIHLKDCEPISIWAIFRHGKRAPGPNFAQNMKYAIRIKDDIVASYSAGRSSLCAQDVEDLKNWKIDTTLFENSFTNEGYHEMQNLGKRFKEAFPKLLQNLEEDAYIFKPVLNDNAMKSAEAFVQGFQDDKLIYLKPTSEIEEAAPYQTCKFYQKEIRLNPKTYTEAFKYFQNADYLAAKDRVQRRTGIDYGLNEDNITALYDLCRYSSSGYDSRLSPWCALFTTNDLQVLEYIGDLRHYYRNGYGNPFAEDFGRIPLINLFTSFEKAKSGKGKKIIAYFSHASILDMIYATLGLFKDDDALTGANRNPERKWNSLKSTFSSNFAAVLHRCSRNETTEFNVVFYNNEEPLTSLCKDRICSWQEFEEKLNFTKPNLEFCDKN